MRIDTTTIKPVSPFGRQQIMYSRQEIYLLYWLLKKLLLYPEGGLGWESIKLPSNAGTRRLVLNRAVKRGCLVSSALFSWICSFICALSSPQMLVFERPSAPESAARLSLVSWGRGHTRCIDWDQPNWFEWRSVTLVNSLPKLGNKLYKIIIWSTDWYSYSRIYHKVYV